MSKRIDEHKKDWTARLNIIVPPDEELEKLVEVIMTKEGYEIPNPRPLEVGDPDIKPPSLQEQVIKIMQHHLIKRQATAAGFETEEEANDFNIGDEPIEESIYQQMVEEEPLETPPEIPQDVDPVEEPAGDEPDAEDPPAEPVDPPAPAE